MIFLCTLIYRWLPETGGANLPALNNLLKPLGIALGDTVLEGNFDLGEHTIYYASGKITIHQRSFLSLMTIHFKYEIFFHFLFHRYTYSSISG